MRELRASLADVVHDILMNSTVHYITSRGRRVAVIGPVSLGSTASRSDVRSRTDG